MRDDAQSLSQMTRALDLSDSAIAKRKAFLAFGEDDVARLEQLHEVLKDYAPEFAADFYQYVLSFEETRALVPDSQSLERLQHSQAAYFEALTAGDYGQDYIHQRLRVGLAHYRVGLAPAWYLGAYAKYLVGLLPEIQRRLGDSPERLVSIVQSLMKVVLFDMELVIDSYIEARDQTIQGLKDYADMVFESMHDGIFVLAPDLSILSANAKGLEMFGLVLSRVVGRHLTEVVEADGLAASALAVVNGGMEQHDRLFCMHTLGEPICKQVRVTIRHVCLVGEEGRILVVVEEVSEEERFWRLAESKLSRSEAMLRHAQSVAKIGSWRMGRVGSDRDVLECSEETCRLLGVTHGTSLSYRGFLDRVHPDERKHVDASWRAARWGAPFCVEHRIRVGGETLWLETRAELEFDAAGQFVAATGTMQDITERKIAELRIEQLAFYDALTGLPNRALFQDRLQQALAVAQRRGESIALMFVDLDRFKEINDTQGHTCGDHVLSEVAQRFRATLRHEEMLARLGGDEFVIIAKQTGRSGATLIAERLKRVLMKPIEVKDCTFSLGASTGIALYPDDGDDWQLLLKHADIAMYRAKSNGGGYCFYGAEMGAQLARRMELARRFTRALHEKQLQLHYQPQCDLQTGKLTGAEALLRWHDPEWGWVGPAEFIPVAVERGLMIALGEWVLTEACGQLQLWAKAGLSLPGRLAINVSTQQIEQPDFAQCALAIVHKAGVEPTRIELEITESSMMLDPECGMRVTQLLVDAGFAFAIDDFGTGHSSLAYLKRFPAQTLKIDMSFVRHMLSDRNDQSIVTTIIAMARSMGLKTLAEGVEEAAQAERLLALGCDEAQGYYFGRPVSPDQFSARWLRCEAVRLRR